MGYRGTVELWDKRRYGKASAAVFIIPGMHTRYMKKISTIEGKASQ